MSFLSKLAISGYTPCSFSDTDIWNMSQLMAHHWRTGAASRDCRRGRSQTGWPWAAPNQRLLWFQRWFWRPEVARFPLPPFFFRLSLPPNLRCFPVIQLKWPKILYIYIYFIPIQCLRVTGHRQPDHQPVMFTPFYPRCKWLLDKCPKLPFFLTLDFPSWISGYIPVSFYASSISMFWMSKNVSKTFEWRFHLDSFLARPFPITTGQRWMGRHSLGFSV